MTKKILTRLTIIILLLFFSFYIHAKNNAKKLDLTLKRLSIEKFIKLAVSNDSTFDKILIDQLTLNYKRDLKLPAKDIVISSKAQYNLYLPDKNGGSEASIALSKLFPNTGTDVLISYNNRSSSDGSAMNSELQLLVSQPIARNAFGQVTRLQDQIIGLEIDIARYQIVEAYEDYMSALIAVYYNWYLAYVNLKISEMSYKENLKLQKNIYKRRKQKIALPIDVNKIELLILGRKEDLINLKEKYNNITNQIRKAVRHSLKTMPAPADPSNHLSIHIEFDKEYNRFTAKSRTYKILDILKKNNSLLVKKYAADLLPSTNIFMGYKITGEDWEISNNEKLFFGGISLKWPLPYQVGKAEYEIAKIERGKSALSNENKYLELQVNIKNLYLAIIREKELIGIAEKKISLSKSILKDEAENYSFGKVTLNDYIDAVNRLDKNKFSKILRQVQLKKLYIEWLRLTDQLVDKRVLRNSK